MLRTGPSKPSFKVTSNLCRPLPGFYTLLGVVSRQRTQIRVHASTRETLKRFRSASSRLCLQAKLRITQEIGLGNFLVQLSVAPTREWPYLARVMADNVMLEPGRGPVLPALVGLSCYLPSAQEVSRDTWGRQEFYVVSPELRLLRHYFQASRASSSLMDETASVFKLQQSLLLCWP